VPAVIEVAKEHSLKQVKGHLVIRPTVQLPLWLILLERASSPWLAPDPRLDLFLPTRRMDLLLVDLAVGCYCLVGMAKERCQSLYDS
jgi:hypothetical protein